MASEGYPGDYEKGREISGLDAADAIEDVKVFHAGTRLDGQRVLSDGGRVLGVTALGIDDQRREAAGLQSGQGNPLARRLVPQRHQRQSPAAPLLVGESLRDCKNAASCVTRCRSRVSERLAYGCAA